METVGTVAQATKEKDTGENVEKKRKRGKKQVCACVHSKRREKVRERARDAEGETEVGDGGERSSSGRSRWCGR